MAKAGLLFVGTDDGLVLFSNPGTVGRWLRVGHELRGQVVTGVRPVADQPLLVLAALEGGGIWRSQDGGGSWEAVLEVEPLVLASFLGHPLRFLLSTYDGSLYASHDGGAIWEPLQNPSGQVLTALFPSADDWLVTGGADGTVWSATEAEAWSTRGTPAHGLIDALAALPGVLFALAGGRLYRQAEPAGPWSPVTVTPADTIDCLAVLPGNTATLLLGIQPGVMARSVDGGVTWEGSASDAPWGGRLQGLAPAPYHMDTVFAGSATGQVAVSTDRGRNWQMIRQDLPPVRAIAAARLA
jgi:photosystem II stability/assembly factor-like uncharacterized protein